MDVYIVIGELDGYGSRSVKFIQSSFVNEKHVLSHAVELASGEISLGGGDTKYLLDSIIKVNTDSKKVTEFELILDDGRFTLSELKNS